MRQGSTAPANRSLAAKNGDAVYMKELIKQVATVQFTEFGFRGVSFGTISEVLETTRSNVHYHFGSKQELASAVTKDAAAKLLTESRENWTSINKTLYEKLLSSLEYNRERYKRFNPVGEHKPWSLITRFQWDADALTPEINAAVANVAREIEIYVSIAVRMAIDKNELRADTPEEHVTLQISNMLQFCVQMTLGTEGFQYLEKSYLAVMDTIARAYGSASVAEQDILRRVPSDDGR